MELTSFMEGSNGQREPLTRQVPKELKLVIELPTVKRVSECDLDVAANNLVVEVSDKFYLDLPLPYEIDPARAEAKFDKHRTPSELVVVMPVVAQTDKTEQPSFSWEDGAVDERDRLDADDDELPDLQDVEPTPALEACEADDSTAEAEETAASASPDPEPKREEPKRERLDAPEDTVPPTPEPRERLDAPDEDFLASATFSGPRPGFVFKTGHSGLGYYRDTPFVPPPRRPAAPKLPLVQEAPARPDEHLVVREVRRTPKTDVDAIDMGELPMVAQGENASRLWAVFAVDGKVEDGGVHVSLRPTQFRLQLTAEVDGQSYAYTCRRLLKNEIDVRQVHWDWSGFGQSMLVVVLSKETRGLWGDEKFVEIAAGAALEEWGEDDEAEEVPEESAEPTQEDDPASDPLPADEPVVPETLSGDALLGQAVPLETRLFLEVF
jgi:hypothetical protein